MFGAYLNYFAIHKKYGPKVAAKEAAQEILNRRKKLEQLTIDNCRAVRKTQKKYRMYYGLLGLVAAVGLGTIIYEITQQKEDDSNLPTIALGGVILLAATSCIDILHRNFSDHLDLFIDYALHEADSDPNDELVYAAKSDLNFIRHNDRLQGTYMLPHTRFANWIIGYSEYGRIQKQVRLKRLTIIEKSFPEQRKQLAKFFGKHTIEEVFDAPTCEE